MPHQRKPHSEPQPGDFFLVPMAGVVGVGIRFGQWLNGDGFRSVQHAGIFLGHGLTIEAMPGGAIEGDISRYDPDSVVWSTDLVVPTDTQRGDILAAALRYKGVPYSFLDYAAIGAHRFGVKTPKLQKYIEASGHMICSQLVDRAYELGGYQLFDDGRWHGDVTPADLDVLLATIMVRND